MTNASERERIRRRARNAIAAAQAIRDGAVSSFRREEAAQRTEARLEREHLLALAELERA